MRRWLLDCSKGIVMLWQGLKRESRLAQPESFLWGSTCCNRKFVPNFPLLGNSESSLETGRDPSLDAQLVWQDPSTVHCWPTRMAPLLRCWRQEVCQKMTFWHTLQKPPAREILHSDKISLVSLSSRKEAFPCALPFRDNNISSSEHLYANSMTLVGVTLLYTS